MNSNGELFLGLSTKFQLHIVNTHFQLKDDHITIWMHPMSSEWHLLDYVIIRTCDMQDVCNIRSLRGTNCLIDGALVRTKMGLVIKPTSRNRITEKLPKCLNV